MGMDFYTEKCVKARKEHICELCNEKILAGEEYRRESGKFEGMMFSRCLHEHCYKMECEYCSEVDNEFDWSEVLEYFSDKYCYDCKHHHRFEENDDWEECDYANVAACPRIKALIMDTSNT